MIRNEHIHGTLQKASLRILKRQTVQQHAYRHQPRCMDVHSNSGLDEVTELYKYKIKKCIALQIRDKHKSVSYTEITCKGYLISYYFELYFTTRGNYNKLNTNDY